MGVRDFRSELRHIPDQKKYCGAMIRTVPPKVNFCPTTKAIQKG